MASTTKTFTDSFHDAMRVQIDGNNLHIKTVQTRRGEHYSTETNMSFSPGVAQSLRDHLIDLFPLPAVVEPSVTVSSVGEVSSIEVTGGSVVIHAMGNVIVNNK